MRDEMTEMSEMKKVENLDLWSAVKMEIPMEM